jgi:hypothetical protein
MRRLDRRIHGTGRALAAGWIARSKPGNDNSW